MRDLNEVMRKGVVAVLTAIGAWLVAIGLVTADVWAQVMEPQVITPIVAVVGVAFWKAFDMVSDWVVGLFKAEEAE